MDVFWDVAPYSLVDILTDISDELEHRVSKCFWKVGKLLPDYTAQHPRREPTVLSLWQVIPSSYLVTMTTVEAENNYLPVFCFKHYDTITGLCGSLFLFPQECDAGEFHIHDTSGVVTLPYSCTIYIMTLLVSLNFVKRNLWNTPSMTRMCSEGCVEQRSYACNFILQLISLRYPLDPLKPSGNYMSHLLQQSVTLLFVFMCFVWFSV
jgi:hypothetical protein